jgi:hypothetical protein
MSSTTHSLPHHTAVFIDRLIELRAPTSAPWQLPHPTVIVTIHQIMSWHAHYKFQWLWIHRQVGEMFVSIGVASESPWRSAPTLTLNKYTTRPAEKCLAYSPSTSALLCLTRKGRPFRVLWFCFWRSALSSCQADVFRRTVQSSRPTYAKRKKFPPPSGKIVTGSSGSASFDILLTVLRQRPLFTPPPWDAVVWVETYVLVSVVCKPDFWTSGK